MQLRLRIDRDRGTDAARPGVLRTKFAEALSHKDPATATARIEARLKRTPNSAGTLLLAARAYQSAGNLKKSEHALRRTIEIDASNLQAYELLTRQYTSQNRLHEVLRELEELSKREPSRRTHSLLCFSKRREKHPRRGGTTSWR
jgi:predicted Zn-dependent protease